MSNAMPFGLLHRDATPMTKRGYGVYPSVFDYDPQAQIVKSTSIHRGPTEPTTTSQVAGTTGFLNSDSDEANDDKGKD